MAPRTSGKADADAESVSSYSGSMASSQVHSEYTGTYRSGTEETNGERSKEEEMELASKETKAVFRLRLLVLGALVIAGVVVAFAIYMIAKRGEDEEYEMYLKGAAEKVGNSFQAIVSTKVGSIVSLAVTFTSFARSQNMTWPNVTMNDFQQRASATRSLSDALFLELLPIVTDETRPGWESYALEHKGWLDEGRAWQEQFNLGFELARRTQEGGGGVSANDLGKITGEAVLGFDSGVTGESTIADQIYALDAEWNAIVDPGPGPYFPIWESSPILISPRDLVNYNVGTYPAYGKYIKWAHENNQIFIGGIDTPAAGGVDDPALDTSFFAFITSFAAGKSVEYAGDPMSSVYVPVFDSYDKDTRKPVAILLAVINWASYFRNILPVSSEPVVVILENSCDGAFTYEVSGTEVKFLGKGDLHEKEFDDHVYNSELLSVAEIGSHSTDMTGYSLNQEMCPYNLRIYPTEQLYYALNTTRPIVITFAVACVFAFAVIMFLVYDRLVERRQKIVMQTAKRTNAIVSSLFPKKIKERLFAEAAEQQAAQNNPKNLKTFLSSNKLEPGSNQEKSFRDNNVYNSKPIADLFLETTVLFADIAGFTAWSSVREPAQVFTLLETIYRNFDDIALRRRIFKVETIGDCYVAVAGLPDPRKDHAVAMARFSIDCLNRMTVLTKQLEVTLGPDTGDLHMRMGMHSGPVTAGVLRGERSRFQLFGDTMNTAARMESTGMKGRIQLSQETADLLIAFGKSNWISSREEKVHAKGKGELQTYWLSTSNRATSSSGQRDSTDVSESEENVETSDQHAAELATMKTQIEDKDSRERMMRLVDWNVDVLARLLKQIVARRKAISGSDTSKQGNLASSRAVTDHVNELSALQSGQTVIDEVKEIIMLPKYNAKAAVKQETPDSIELSPAVLDQLRDYVTNVANLYQDNPFHNFEHASHVAMSVSKLLSRIVAPNEIDIDDNLAKTGKTLHDHTYGITSDPLTQFACVFSALIHDVDHPGVPNTQLVKEKAHIAEFYGGKSVAEQNSVDLAWHLLMDEAYGDLRKTIYRSEESYNRFRQLVVNSVMATDIVDKELKALRNARWAKAFSEQSDKSEVERACVSRKATIVIEHLIQASDVAHTMQHWYIYRKWNERFFMECYKAFLDGRADTDPSIGWYKGEIGFFDFYIIPLAKKLKDCGVFGVSSDEYLDYAEKNRQEWELRGEAIVQEMLQLARSKFDVDKRLEL